MLYHMTSHWAETLGYVSSISLPLFNIPLMIHLVRRKSSKDLSLTWVLGVFFCLGGMLPAGFQSVDPIFRIFSFLNFAFFAGVTFLTLYFRYSSANSK